MYFYATCPHCRDAELQVPEHKRGTTAHCPKCGKDFTLQPGGRSKYDHVEDAAPPPRKQRKAQATAPAGPAVAVAEPAAAAPDPNVVTAGPEPDAGPDRSWDVPTVFALAAVGLLAPAMIATQFPYGRLIALPFLVVGLAVAGLSLLGLEKRPWLGWAGVGLNALGLLFVVALPGWLRAGPWLPVTVAVDLPKVPVAVDRSGHTQPADWVNARDALWQMGDVRVAVAAAALEPPPPKGKEFAVRVRLKVVNAGLDAPVEFAGWAFPAAGVKNPPPAPTLTADGTALAPRPGPPAGPASPIRPGQSADAELLFAAPARPGDLRLELPAQAFGGTEPPRFVIPWAMLAGHDRFPARPPTPRP